jgi:prepilin-type N-terminal cleavage/methylation domain-containing protein
MLNTQFGGKPHPLDERGFTFVEVLIVIAIFSIGVLAVAIMQVSAINTNASARMSGEATALATNQLEALMALNYEHADLNPDTPHEIVQGPYTITWNVTESDMDEDDSNDSKTIFVTVHCANPKANDVQIQYIKPEI